MSDIPGTPEGRAGVWLVTAETAAALLEALPGDELHNLLSSGAPGIIACGANWSKAQAVELVRRADVRVALVFPPNLTYRHQLVALNDEHRWAFDIGAVGESRMAAPAAEEG